MCSFLHYLNVDHDCPLAPNYAALGLGLQLTVLAELRCLTAFVLWTVFLDVADSQNEIRSRAELLKLNVQLYHNEW